MSQEGYPITLPDNAKVFNTIYPEQYNPNYDIVWSFDFNLSGIDNNAEGGITTFLIPGGIALTGGNIGIDLGYSGLSAESTTYPNISCGINQAVIGVGIDTKGYFALSASVNGTETRDGVDSNQLNYPYGGLCVRKGAPKYEKISDVVSLPNNIKVLNNDGSFISVRCRLGNLGRVLYIDCKNSRDPYYINVLNVPTDLNIILQNNIFYSVGISFASPLSTSDASKTAVLRIQNFHIEGRTDIPSKSDQLAPEDISRELFTLVTEMCATTGGYLSTNDAGVVVDDTGTGVFPLSPIFIEQYTDYNQNNFFFVNR